MNSRVTIVIVLAIAAIFGILYFKPFNSSKTTGNLPTQAKDIYQGWQEQTVDEIGLTLKTPPDTRFRKEIGDNAGNIRTVAFYVEKGDENDPQYQLYGLFLADKEASAQDLERAKIEMDTSTIKEATIAGYQGIEGLIIGPKTRYITSVLKEERLFSVSTYPPIQENKEFTEKILKTFQFK